MSERNLFYPDTLFEKDGKLVQVGNKCNNCGKTSFPAVELCPFCSSDNLVKVPLSKVGTIFSFSITRVPVGQFKPPIIGAYIDLPEGTRIFGHIHAGEEEVNIGMKVRLETGVLYINKDGIEVCGYYYVPLNNDEGGTKQ